MTIKFKELEFEADGGRIFLTRAFGSAPFQKELRELCVFVEAHIAGENAPVSRGAKQFMSSEWDKLRYVSHTQTDNALNIVQRSALIEVVTHFSGYPDTNAARVYNTVKNVSDAPVVLEHISSLVLYGLGSRGVESAEKLFLYRFTNSWHVECQPRRLSFFDSGLFKGSPRSMKRISGCNTGSWSSKEELPQAIIEDAESGVFLMFQIENNGGWYWEIGENCGKLYLNIGGPNQHFNQWSKRLEPGEEFDTVAAAVCSGGSLNGVLGAMTAYRRHIAPKNKADENLPVIFNEYMHLAWDNPSEELTKKIAPAAAEAGARYYVIDCGWHNEEDAVYSYVGHWRESAKRFPSGVKKTVGFIRSLGMKAGLWIEPESFGHLCGGMDGVYDDSCFFVRNGKRVLNMGRYQLDFRSEKVRAYMDGVFKRMIADYGAEYIKIDYNQCAGPGTELNADSLGDGLLSHARAYLQWFGGLTKRYPNVIFENCGSGGQRMDYAMLALHSLQSTSDQTDYKKYPFIAANMLGAVLPEQAGVWSYPKPRADAAVDDETVIFNTVNALLGRMHLASHIETLTARQTELVREGAAYYNRLTPFKKKSSPFFPLGFADFRDKFVSGGFTAGGKLFLAVWNLDGAGERKIPLGQAIKSVKTGYPKKEKTDFSWNGDTLTVTFNEPYRARFFEIIF
ncbi:MAG: alpha-galactosidase [Clostridiales bacterium]|jgi:alpha-galactosidase|nr:alpha-galactosidase [Clostridiales bacterium]